MRRWPPPAAGQALKRPRSVRRPQWRAEVWTTWPRFLPAPRRAAFMNPRGRIAVLPITGRDCTTDLLPGYNGFFARTRRAGTGLIPRSGRDLGRGDASRLDRRRAGVGARRGARAEVVGGARSGDVADVPLGPRFQGAHQPEQAAAQIGEG